MHEERGDDDRSHAEQIQRSWQRRAVAQEHPHRRDRDERRAAPLEQPVVGRDPVRVEDRIDPDVLEKDLPGDQLGQEDHDSADDKGVRAVPPPRTHAAGPAGAQAVEAEESEVLGGEVVRHEAVVDDDQELWVFAGSIVGPGQHELVGPNNDIVVPPMFWKIVIRGPDDNEEFPTVLAFLFPHQRVSHGDIEDFLVSVDIIEALSGLDFFTVFELGDQHTLEDEDTSLNWAVFEGS